ncbi:zinc finger protein 488 [Dendropsophus ebraccatus]|uniref:zinc finger protein 488 n=1 Tax=Dendropsophus ebraccatus TaxID=150705 RepID=UPI0038319EDF
MAAAEGEALRPRRPQQQRQSRLRMWLRLVPATPGASMDNRLEELIQEGASGHLHKGEPLLLLYHGQLAAMLGLQELRSLHHEKDGTSVKRRKHGTNFHSLARDVEREGTGLSEEVKARLVDKHEAENGEDFLLEMASDLTSAVWKRVKAELLEAKRSAFTEVCRVRRRGALGSAFSPVPNRANGKVNTVIKSAKSLRTSDASDGLDHGYDHFLSPHGCLAVPNSLAILPLSETLPKCETPPPPQVLPPTFSTLGSTAQIWCAKCKVSFRMTSDLVLHMRLRHKKEAGLETHGKRARELQLSCPVCYAYFRERHHLSRHMTSHC